MQFPHKLLFEFKKRTYKFEVHNNKITYPNVLKEMLQLLPMQKNRLMKQYCKEAQLPILDREVSAELAQYMKMLTEIAKLETPQFLHSGATLACVATAIDKAHDSLPDISG